LQQKSVKLKDVVTELKKRCALDQKYRDGRIFCSMCTTPHPVAKKAFKLFFESNLGDSGLFPVAAQLEREVVSQLATLLGSASACGFIVSGGTEANLLAILAAKNTANKEHPEVVLPQSAHFSFTKICNMLNVKPVYAPLDDAYRVKPAAVEALINRNTVAIVGTAGTSELGAVDPIDALSTIALRHGVHLHVDAAFGGLVIPFLDGVKPSFDFSLEGVKTVTVDPHKMGLATIPAGGILFRDQKMLDVLKTETPYLTDRHQYTFVGTRTGASAASAWAVFRVLGREGFQKMVAKCMKNTLYLARTLDKEGFNLLCKPTLNVIGFRGENTKHLADQLRHRGWFVSYISRYDCIRIVLMPHIKRRDAVAFMRDLKEAAV